MNLSKIVEQEVTMNNQRMDRERDLILSGRPPTLCWEGVALGWKEEFPRGGQHSGIPLSGNLIEWCQRMTSHSLAVVTRS